ncbi:response regulator [Labilibacter sediminis]|nr:response regulator [Labilibacter sediminis]
MNALLSHLRTMFLALVTLICSSAYGDIFHFNTLTVNDGLTQHDVSCTLQDSYGFIWIGTYDGLNRFDGYKVINYTSESQNEESLSSNRIKCLFEDSKQRLWIGTDGYGLNYYSLKSNKFIRVKTPDRYNRINAVAENSLGEILVGTSLGILKIVEDETNVYAELMQLPLTGLTVNNIVTSSNNTFYFTTNSGIWMLKNGQCSQIKQVKNFYYQGLTLDKNGNIWAARSGELIRIKTYNKTHQVETIPFFSDMTIKSLCTSLNGDIWIGTLNKGLYQLDPTQMTIKNHILADYSEERSLLSNSVLNLSCDKTNTLWIANRQGLCYTNLNPKKFSNISLKEISHKYKHPHIRALFIDDNYLYFGIQQGECYRFNMESRQLENIQQPGKLNPNRIEKINDQIYISTNKGVYIQDNDNLNFSHQSSTARTDLLMQRNIFPICSDKWGKIYYGAFSGLIVQDKESTNWIHNIQTKAEILRGKRIFDLLYDQNENCIWIGTIADGIYKMNLTSNGEFLSLEIYNHQMQNNYHIANNTIWCFFKDSNEDLWAGTDAGLLIKPKGSNAFNQIEVPGVMDKKIMGILEDDQSRLWLSNSQGIISFDPDSHETQKYTYNDGLNTSTFTEAVGKSSDGTLYFGSINGITYFNPGKIKPSPYKSNVKLTDFKVHNTSIKPGEEYFGSPILKNSINATVDIVLNYEQNNFLFEFAGTNYSNVNKNKFRHMLKGYDRKWIHTTSKHRFATYSNLKPGDYTFIVDAANQDGIWSEHPKEIRIKVFPAPWQTTWAYMGYTSILVCIVLIFLYFWHNRQKLKHQIELGQINQQQEQELHEFKLMFFTDVAHEFKTPLSLIIGPLNDLMRNNLTKDSRDFCFHVISRNTQRMMFLVSQLLDFRKINAQKNILKVEECNLAAFIQQTTQAFLWQAQNENIHFNVLKPEEFICYFDKDIIEKVLYNVISNAFKYTPENGIIELELKPIWKDNQQIANLTVRDSGKGIPDNEKNKIFDRYFHGKDRYASGIGLHLSYTLIKAHRGDINVADSNYGGAEFILSIPVSKENFSNTEISTTIQSRPAQQDVFMEVPKTDKTIAEERERILVVEDDHDLRAYLKNCLQTNYHISEANNGKEGIEKAIKDIPDIIVSDVMMPEMDGVEMCQQLKNDNQTSHIPILMLTAKSAEEYQKQGLESGAWDYISKPFNTESLLQKINNIIKTRNLYKTYLLDQNVTLEVKQHYTPYDQKFISKVTKLVEANISKETFTVEDLAREIGLSRMQLHRKLKSLVGQTTTSFINTIKIKFTTNLFDQGCDRIQEAMEAVGFSSYSHFNTTFKKIIGKTASEYIADKNS